MSDTSTTIPAVAADPVLPTAAIVCIAIGGYLLIVIIILMVRQCLLSRGICGECNCCGKEGEPQCCECWIGFAECCNCCRSPNIESCLDSVCPQRRKCCQSMDFADVVTCQCCGEGGCCGENEQCCDCDSHNCTCGCQPPECDSCSFCCFEISLKQQPAQPVATAQPQHTTMVPQHHSTAGLSWHAPPSVASHYPLAATPSAQHS